ncbi:unnamed protein product [Clavelina lepadiformis]|uniref:C-type lectin domain-containing protein n=1 Tax=Clavelina lepadiformis TaxID=159417 RepID=A0ABP0FJU2_CLALP
MERVFSLIASGALFQLLKLSLVTANCLLSWQVIDNNLFILSDHQNTSIEAENQCLANGGFLANVENHDLITQLYLLMDNKYTTNLQTVFQFSDEKNRRYSNTRNVSSSWGIVSDFPQFNLYKSPTGEYKTPIDFCKHPKVNPEKWWVNYGECDNGWFDDFTLYGGQNSTPAVREIFCYRNSFWSTRLTLSPMILKPYLWNVTSIYIPDINVFIGARSDVGESNWFWNDGSLVTDPSFPSSNSSVCQQMAYHYSDNKTWELSPHSCGLTKAYYICQIKFDIEANPVLCDGTSLTVSWKPDLFSGLLQSLNLLQINIMGMKFYSNFSTGSIIVPNLIQRASYFINATVSSQDCPRFKLTSNTIRATTGSGLPDPVTTAFVKNQSNQCVVEWIHNSSDINILQYEVIATSNVNSTLIVFSNLPPFSFPAEQILRMVVSLDIHGAGVAVSMTIRACTCAGSGQFSPVSGFCISPSLPQCQLPVTETLPPTPQSMLGIIVGLIGTNVLTIAVFTVLLIYCRRRAPTGISAEQTQSASKHSIEERNQAITNNRNKQCIPNSKNESELDRNSPCTSAHCNAIYENDIEPESMYQNTYEK